MTKEAVQPTFSYLKKQRSLKLINDIDIRYYYKFRSDIMFRKKAKSIDDVKEILPNDLSDKSSDFNIVELENMVNDLENQIKNMKEGYENGLRELNMRIRSMEDDFKYVIESLNDSNWFFKKLNCYLT